jgi:hypothetical protein ELI_4153
MRNLPARDDRNFGLSTFEDFFRPFFAFDERPRVMKTDISEKDGNYVLDIDLPGFEKKDIDVSLNDGYLTVSAKRDQSNEEKDQQGNYIRRERYSGSYSRSYYVGDLDENEISASYDKGILCITFPKEDEKRLPGKKNIEIK